MENLFIALNDLLFLVRLNEENPDVVLTKVRVPERKYYLPLVNHHPEDLVYYPLIVGTSKKCVMFLDWLVKDRDGDRLTLEDREKRVRGQINLAGQPVHKDGFGPRVFYGNIPPINPEKLSYANLSKGLR